MKTKAVAILLVLILVLTFGTTAAFADEIMPLYNEVSMVESWMGITGNTLSYGVCVYPDDTLDYVHIEAELRRTSGVLVNSYSEDLEEIYPTFEFSKSKTVSTRGTYFLKYTLTCYKNGRLVDTISKETVTATY